MNLYLYIKKHFWQLFRYGAVSVVSISFFLGLNYLFIDLLHINARLGYFLAASLAYTSLYFSSSNFIFRQTTNHKNAHYFLIHVLVFWSLSNIFFNVVYSLTGWHYGVITILNTALFFPLRFYSQKYLVFKDHPISLS